MFAAQPVFVAQPTRDLFRGIPRTQPPDYLGAQPRAGIELAHLGSLPRHRGGPLRSGGPVAFPAAVAGDLPADHARVPPDPSRDHRPADTLRDPPGDLFPTPPGTHIPAPG